MPLPQRTRGANAARVSAVLGAAILVAACKGGGAAPSWMYASQAPAASGGSSAAPSGAPATTAPTVEPTAAPSPGASTSAFARNPAAYVEGATYTQAINAADFVERVSHPFMPLQPDSKWVYDGDEHIEITVLPDTKLILGVHATVVRDQVFVDGELAEDTLDWFAQDRDGNVWYFGEQTAEYEKGKVTSTAGSWEAGVDGALPGIALLALPQVGDQYRQEYLAGEAEDLATVTALTGSISVPAGSWSGENVLVTEEWTPLEPGVRERKTYARGFGVVETRAIEGDPERTTLTSFQTSIAVIE
jgi:hypothetical protein